MKTYTVVGSWPFPLDMLRRDGSKAATEKDEALIAWLSADDCPGPAALHDSTEINLVVYDEIRPYWAPNVARWQSFGWEVRGYSSVIERNADMKRRADLRMSALAKLTAEERDVLGLN